DLSSAATAAEGNLAQGPEAGAHVADEEFGLLECGEVPAFWHLAPVAYIGEVALHPAPHRGHDLLGEYGHAGRYLDLARRAAASEALPIEAGGGGGGGGPPAHHHRVQPGLPARG